MTDTPPYYWLNGEDGPLEEENHPTSDGVLAARPMACQTGTSSSSQNGLLTGLDLSRSRDRKRHGCEGPPSTTAVDTGSTRPPIGLQMNGLASPALHQFARCNSIPGPAMTPFANSRQGVTQLMHSPALPTPQQSQCYAPSTFSPNMGHRWPANGTSAGGHQAAMPVQQQGQGQTQVPTRNLARAPSNVQRRPVSPVPGTRTPPASPGTWTPNASKVTSQGELQSSSSFHRSSSIQKTNSFISGHSAYRSSSFTAAPLDGMVGNAPSPVPSKQTGTSAPCASPMGTGGPMLYPPSPASAHGSFEAASPAPKPPRIAPPTCTRVPPLGNAYIHSPAQGTRAQPQVFASQASQFHAQVGGTWSAPVPGMAIPTPTTPSMETRGSLGSASASNIRRICEANPTRQANASRLVDVHHEAMMQNSTSRSATSSTDGQRHSRPSSPQRRPSSPQRSAPAQERIRVRRNVMDEQGTQQTAAPVTSPWMEAKNKPQSPAITSYGFGQAVANASGTSDFRLSSLASGQSDEGYLQVPGRARQGGMQVPVHPMIQQPETIEGIQAPAHPVMKQPEQIRCIQVPVHPVIQQTEPIESIQVPAHPVTKQPEKIGRRHEALRILVTGASGLLGRQVLQTLNGFNVRGLCRSRGRGTALVSCDLTIEGEATRQIEDFSPHIVIHLAGIRSDGIHGSAARSRRLNVDSSGAIAAACEFSGAWLLFVSSADVFDGSSPPYAEDDSPKPVSEYGWHKLHAEKVLLAACPRSAVLRLPLLYGPVEFLAESVVSEIYSNLRIGTKELDHHQKCYPTSTCDVAKAIRAMIDMHISGKEVRGIFHWQGSEQFTKYDIGTMIASACGFPAPRPQPRDAIDGADSPTKDARLDCSRLQGLLSSCDLNFSFTPLREGLRSCLEVFHDAKLDTSKLLSRVEDQSKPSIYQSGRFMLAEEANAPESSIHSGRFMPSEIANAPELSRHGGRFMLAERTSAPESSSLFGCSETLVQRERKEDNLHNRLQTTSLRSEDGQAARAAALKNVFREELELAWRRYREAAYDENVVERSHEMFSNSEHLGVLV